MCEWQQVRYVHHMRHADYHKVLEVGCDCAGYMQGDLTAARQRERTLKSRQKRRAKWTARKWKISKRGNPWLETKGHHITIFRRASNWTFRVSREYEDFEQFSDATFPTVDQAKLAAFDFIWPPHVRVA